MTFARGDVVKRTNLVTGQENIGIVLSVDAHLVTTRWRLTDTATLVRTHHEMHAGEHVDARLLENETIRRALAVIAKAEAEAQHDDTCALCETGEEPGHEH